MPGWLHIIRDPAVLRRAALTSFGVGTVLTVVNNVDLLLAGMMVEYRLLPIAITYLVPFLVSLATSVFAIRVERRGGQVVELLEREIDAINRFPGQNPNAVLRVTHDGRLTYANDASAPIRSALGVEVGDIIGRDRFEALVAAASATPPGRIEVRHDRQTFAVLPVHVPELGVYNLYGTDITAAKVVERFPDRNPNPVLRMSPEGVLRYANVASAPIRTALGIDVGDVLPGDLLASLQAALANPAAPPVEVAGDGRTFRLSPVQVPEFEFINLYGTDVTAQRAIDKFPNENPNPVLRLSRNGTLTYANPASSLVRAALGAEVGQRLPQETLDRILGSLGDGAVGAIEIEQDGRVYTVRVVQVYEFDSINLYGTDVTAARQVEALSTANEELLLNILPKSIAERLRAGERVIADRFDDMAVLFADVVGFTELSSRMSPTDVVTLLNEIFSECDRLADAFQLEKIKTVGDAYMVVGGLQTIYGHEQAVHASFATDVARLGLAIIAETDRIGRARGTPMQVRVGMNVGPAVAGVIGIRKFIYDVWGDTVNTASRMESTGVPGRIQVTDATRRRLEDAFEFERRGVVDVKGKGPIETWFLVGPRNP